MLPKGSVHRKGALPLPCDITFERDVAVPMRDGTIIYVDIFRPARERKVPAIIAWSPYGKKGGNQTLDQLPGRLGIPVSALSDLQVWEGPDPAYWCSHGYAIVNADARGAFMSEGDIYQWGSQDGEDGYDLIEWLAAQEWCNGKMGMSGKDNSGFCSNYVLRFLKLDNLVIMVNCVIINIIEAENKAEVRECLSLYS